MYIFLNRKILIFPSKNNKKRQLAEISYKGMKDHISALLKDY